MDFSSNMLEYSSKAKKLIRKYRSSSNHLRSFIESTAAFKSIATKTDCSFKTAKLLIRYSQSGDNYNLFDFEQKITEKFKKMTPSSDYPRSFPITFYCSLFSLLKRKIGFINSDTTLVKKFYLMSLLSPNLVASCGESSIPLTSQEDQGSLPQISLTLKSLPSEPRLNPIGSLPVGTKRPTSGSFVLESNCPFVMDKLPVSSCLVTDHDHDMIRDMVQPILWHLKKEQTKFTREKPKFFAGTSSTPKPISPTNLNIRKSISLRFV
ncbi:hypothetical protein EGR_09853 [Echinococcus granulosus]|uniref:Uncharacterized protein n=1 Tax=Echinococcus granulosus TaxID=6210 RepID=W6U2J0_ECHGR|nr:hypothetical protein EGR_09853 [Echinococcus granulosus]EUB55288.1 hypothetical protein EGR_09853 [Echinococcus granulosus]